MKTINPLLPIAPILGNMCRLLFKSVFFLLICVMILLTQCGKETTQPPPDPLCIVPDAPTLNIVPNEHPLSVTAASTSDNSVAINSNVAWSSSITSTGDWITSLSPATGTGICTEKILNIAYEANTAASARRGTITFTETTSGVACPALATLVITQAAAYVL